MYVAAYLLYFIYFFAVPFFAPFFSICDSCLKRRKGHEERSHRFILAWRLVRNGIPTLSSFVILVPESPAICAAIMLFFFFMELLIAAVSRCYQSALGRAGLPSYAIYIFCTLVTLICTGLYASDAQFQSSPAVGTWGSALIFLNFFLFPAAILLSLGCSLRNHATDDSLLYLEAGGAQKLRLSAYSTRDKRGAPPSGCGPPPSGCGGCALANAWLCLRPFCQDAKSPTGAGLHHRHFAVNSDYSERCWFCDLRQDSALKLRVLHPDLEGKAGHFLCVERETLHSALRAFVDDLDRLVGMHAGAVVAAKVSHPLHECALAQLLATSVVGPAVKKAMAPRRVFGFLDLTNVSAGELAETPAPSDFLSAMVISPPKNAHHTNFPKWYAMHLPERFHRELGVYAPQTAPPPPPPLPQTQTRAPAPAYGESGGGGLELRAVAPSGARAYAPV